MCMWNLYWLKPYTTTDCLCVFFPPECKSGTLVHTYTPWLCVIYVCYLLYFNVKGITRGEQTHTRTHAHTQARAYTRTHTHKHTHTHTHTQHCTAQHIQPTTLKKKTFPVDCRRHFRFPLSQWKQSNRLGGPRTVTITESLSSACGSSSNRCCSSIVNFPHRSLWIKRYVFQSAPSHLLTECLGTASGNEDSALSVK